MKGSCHYALYEGINKSVSLERREAHTISHTFNKFDSRHCNVYFCFDLFCLSFALFIILHVLFYVWVCLCLCSCFFRV